MAMRMERFLRAGRIELTAEELAALERRAKNRPPYTAFFGPKSAPVASGPAHGASGKYPPPPSMPSWTRALAEDVTAEENPRVAYDDEFLGLRNGGRYRRRHIRP